MSNRFINLNEKPLKVRLRNFMIIAGVCSVAVLLLFTVALLPFILEMLNIIQLHNNFFIFILIGLFGYLVFTIITMVNMDKGIELAQEVAHTDNIDSGFIIAIALTSGIGTISLPFINFISLILIIVFYVREKNINGNN